MKNRIMRVLTSAALIMTMTVSLVSCGNKGAAGTENAEASEEPSEAAAEDDGADLLFSAEDGSGSSAVEGTYTEGLFVRPTLIDVSLFSTTEDEVTAKVAPYKVDADLGNLINGSDFSDFEEGNRHLSSDGFYVQKVFNCEFYEVYENNRYLYVPNFVTVDSLMHAYHLYFAHVMKDTEKNRLCDILISLTDRMLDLSKSQRADMGLASGGDAKTKEWDTSSDRNIAFFAVAKALLDEGYDPSKDKEIDEKTREVIRDELSLIDAASGISASPLAGDEGESEDYSQYKPRGYYDTDEALKRYFKAMMWYGRRNFTQDSESMDRSAMLMTLAMDDKAYEDWSTIYAVTSFFAGASDDNGVCEYLPLIEEAYGKSRGELKGSDIMDDGAFDKFHEATGKLDPPEINSVPMEDDGGKTDKAEANSGFRFMGQRFSVDAAIFQKLIYSSVGENKNGEKRMLPEALDIPAAFGNKTAEDILTNDLKAKEYSGYAEKLAEVQDKIKNSSDDTWYASLYSEWLNTLRPLLEEKGSGFPMFMQSEGWKYKALESFLGSYTELKHDTILYSKQVIAEAGGDDPEEKDDRGYVEPEVKVYKRFMELAEGTSAGLEKFGLLSDTAKTDLERLRFLAESFKVISEKELREETLTDDEYELIRSYGAEIEHFWEEANKDEVDSDFNEYSIASNMFPAALVVDVATNPEGSVLELATGRVSNIYVVVPVDGSLKVARGAVYDFYQFEQPLSDRLTDHEWRVMLGIDADDNGDYHWEGDEIPDKPEWTERYRITLD
ncbi:MAG: DUF3160 domain-containing protein [Lachnospiraceae bacterium]|nr:DUF3160 domain-containing protein [Lachnospiraceae bacterium]